MKAFETILCALLPLCALATDTSERETASIDVDGQALVTYQALPMTDHYKGAAFQGSNFIHPLKTPSGFVLTESAPTTDHPHHFGLWWPWKHIEVEGRQILCWELQKGDGIVEARGAKQLPNGLIGESVYVDRKAPEGPVIRLLETTCMTVSEIIETPANGYFLDMEIEQRCAADEPITVTPYRYSGYSIRCTPAWWDANSSVLTSEGVKRVGSNMSRARWVRIEGVAGEGETAGLLMLSHPQNPDFPEKLRTWEKGRVFVNFNSVAEKPLHYEPGRVYVRKYRLFAYDGELSAEEAEGLWLAYVGE
ncbi:PmoA family protein [Coraliomargarita akajimensis]|uniref:Methane oxygenase PmoA n=1 Tax=Coraliomargarita akajimensis (strain DSM 45221 / IAM 15411 / JCM 23193 / KCTC 12865 / 04OKA010-24) TaxID=583355 RepID=D5EQY8_CORAD|nr:PmoA family protein [Coraliomargarita akajimensis]ADE53981.1 conserved hypothetical protein [Coraliomargarita akajimensis DSM 45221]